jgi:hypothetical protein
VSRFARRTDDNHRQVVEALRKAGAWVHSTAALGGGFPDLLVCHRGRLFLLEVKDGLKPPSGRKLTPAESAFIQACPVEVHVVLSPADALRAIGLEVAA